MSDTESFIEEVTEEVNRDKLFALMRRYGWIAILLVFVLVGGAAFNEWQKASAKAEAEAFGDQILTALDEDDSATRLAALAAIESSGENAALVALIEAGEAFNSGATDQAAAALTKLRDDATADPMYRDLAALKLVLMQGAETPAKERIAALETLTTAGAPFRLLAEEQIALIEAQNGQTAEALTRLEAISQDSEATSGLRNRASQLIVALGGTLSES